MDAMTSVLTEESAFAPALLGSLWRASIGGLLFAGLIWAICRLLPRLPAATRFWIWWMVSAKLLLGMAVGASDFPLMSAFVLRLPAQHPAAAPAFFVARLAVQPARLLYSNQGRPVTVSDTKTGRESVPADFTRTPAAEPDRRETVLSGAVSNSTHTLTPKTGSTHPLPGLWPLLTTLAATVWCAGFLLRLTFILKGLVSPLRTIQRGVPAPESVYQEAHTVARLLGIRRLPRILMDEDTPSPFLAGLLGPTIVLPDSVRTKLSAAELRMALAHELTHLRRKDLWLALVPSLAEALFFFLPVARWASRECDFCREEICDSAAVMSLGTDLLTDYGQLLLKVTLASQTSRRPSPQMGMAVTASPSFVQLRRRLKSLKKTIHCPASPHLRRSAALLLAVCLPGILPWHLRALPRSAAIEPETAGDDAIELPVYTAVDLGTLGGKFSDAYAVAEDGRVTGTANVFPLGGRGHAFLWQAASSASHSGAMIDLCEGSVYRHSLAYGVNERGQVAAAAFNNPLKPNAFLWTRGGTQRRYLGSLPGFRFSRATGINNEGMVVGAALGTEIDRRGATRMRAFSWRSGRIQDMGTLGGDFSSAVAISDSGYIAGKSDIAPQNGGTTHAAVWQPGDLSPRDIGTLPGGGNSAASAVNEQGDVVGFSETFETSRRAFLYRSGILEDLGALPVSDPTVQPISTASGINDAGWIVGSSSSLPLRGDKASLQEAIHSRAVLWLPLDDSRNKRRLIDLNDCLPPNNGWTLEYARAVNNKGEIVGIGLIDGKRHAFLLRPMNTEIKEAYSSRESNMD